MQPTTGRLVHYQHGTGDRATVSAMVTSVEDGGVTLTIFLPGVEPKPVLEDRGEPRVVRYADEPTDGHWNWPPRV